MKVRTLGIKTHALKYTAHRTPEWDQQVVFTRPEYAVRCLRLIPVQVGENRQTAIGVGRKRSFQRRDQRARVRQPTMGRFENRQFVVGALRFVRVGLRQGVVQRVSRPHPLTVEEQIELFHLYADPSSAESRQLDLQAILTG